jgi:hypothetical protein
MANIKIIIDGPLMDGHKVTFKAPCACTEVEKLDVRYVEDNTQKSKLFTMKDTHGNDLTGIGNLFAKDAYVHVILDTVNGFAYLQNGDTNGYIEDRIGSLSNPNLFVNGNFQIWQRQSWFEVEGDNAPVCTADRWMVSHSDSDDIFEITQMSTGLKISGASARVCSIYQVLDTQTYEFIKGKTLTLSYAYTMSTGTPDAVEYEYIEEKRCIVASDIDSYSFAINNAITMNTGCVLHWVKLEIGERATPFTPKTYSEELRECQRYFYRLSGYYHAVLDKQDCIKIDVPQIEGMPKSLRLVRSADIYLKIYCGNNQNTLYFSEISGWAVNNGKILVQQSKLGAEFLEAPSHVAFFMGEIAVDAETYQYGVG